MLNFTFINDIISIKAHVLFGMFHNSNISTKYFTNVSLRHTQIRIEKKEANFAFCMTSIYMCQCTDAPDIRSMAMQSKSNH